MEYNVYNKVTGPKAHYPKLKLTYFHKKSLKKKNTKKFCKYCNNA